MQRRIAILIVCVMSTMTAKSGAWAGEYESGFGFGISVPDIWLVLTQGEVAKNAGILLDENGSFGMESVPLAMRRIVHDRVAAGELEIFYRRDSGFEDFVDNVNVLVQPSAVPATREQVAGICRILPGEFSRVFGRPIGVEACEIRERIGRRTLYLQFDGPIPGTTTMQYQIRRGRDLTLVITATSTVENFPRLLGEFEGMIASIRMY